jgi:hypothetical protein
LTNRLAWARTVPRDSRHTHLPVGADA